MLRSTTDRLDCGFLYNFTYLRIHLKKWNLNSILFHSLNIIASIPLSRFYIVSYFVCILCILVPSDFTFKVHLRIENKRIIIRSLRAIKNVKFRRVKRDFLSGNAKPLISNTRAYDIIIDTHLVRAYTYV